MAKVTDTIAVRLEPADRQTVLDMASKYDLTMSQIVRRALVLYIQHVKDTGSTDVIKENFTAK